MKEYLAKRILMIIPTLLGITVVVFLAMHMIPGDPVDLLLAEDYSEEARQMIMREYGLDQPLHIQYIKWLWQMVQGNWGYSILTDRPVLPDVLMKLPISLELIVVSMLVAMLIAVPAGIISATKPYSPRDYAAMTTALIGNSVPDFYVGILLVLLFSHTLDLLPVNGFVKLSDSVWGNISHIILPAAALGFARAAILTRLVRASMLEVLKLDYVTTARAKGVRERWVILKHALQNALIPTLTVVGLQVGFIIGGAIVVETLFTVPGLGQFGIDAISGRDYPQVQAFIVGSGIAVQRIVGREGQGHMGEGVDALGPGEVQRRILDRHAVRWLLPRHDGAVSFVHVGHQREGERQRAIGQQLLSQLLFPGAQKRRRLRDPVDVEEDEFVTFRRQLTQQPVHQSRRDYGCIHERLESQHARKAFHPGTLVQARGAGCDIQRQLVHLFAGVDREGVVFERIVFRKNGFPGELLEPS